MGGVDMVFLVKIMEDISCLHRYVAQQLEGSGAVAVALWELDWVAVAAGLACYRSAV